MRDADDIPGISYSDGGRKQAAPGEYAVTATCQDRPDHQWPPTVEGFLARRLDRDRDDEEPGYVIHLPIRVLDLAAATTLAGWVADSLDFLPELDAGETTVSTADDQNNRHRVFCDLPLSDRSRCPKRYGHPGPCGPADAGRRPVPRPVIGP